MYVGSKDRHISRERDFTKLVHFDRHIPPKPIFTSID
nr:MAG TPA: hypothetical protein [Caudoviricetes sp.]